MKKCKNIQKMTNITKFLSKSDPFGSYTGNSLDGSTPIQDVDDL